MKFLIMEDMFTHELKMPVKTQEGISKSRTADKRKKKKKLSNDKTKSKVYKYQRNI